MRLSITRLSITARLALLAIGLALVTAFAMAALVWQQTHDDAIDALRRDTIEQSNGLAAVYRSGGMPALVAAIDGERQLDDDSLIAEVVDRNGRKLAGVGPERPLLRMAAEPFRIAAIGSVQPWTGEAGVVVRPIGAHWLISGRVLDDWERAQRAIERALLLAIVIAIALGVGGGLLLTRYVTRRLDRIAGVVDAVAIGNLASRVGGDGGRDAFDRLAARIDGMLERIERLMDELRIVTDSIAHDLRSPVARLRARAETALAVDGEERDTALTSVIGEADVIARMLSVLLEISRTEAASRETLVPTDVAELVEEVGDFYTPVTEEAGLAFSVSIATCRKVPMHRELIVQAIGNLIENGLRHAAEGGELALRCIVMGGELQIAVADRGRGIMAEDRALALSRFGRLDAARSQQGAGLGLALVDAVARLHGGTLTLDDHAPGLIATIRIPLPA